MLPENILQLINQPTFDPRLRDRINEWGQFLFFVEFVKQNETKILKLLKTRKEDEDKRDIGTELYIGFAFCKTNCQVIYEPDVPTAKNPDFKISFEDNSFFCEVKRLRKNVIGEISNKEMYRKCGDIICEKIVQTVPNEINIIYIRTKMSAPNLWDLETAVKKLFELKKTDPKEFLRKIKRKINSINEFDKYWKQLSAIVLSKRLWENLDALKPLTPIIKLKIEEAIQTPFRYNSFSQEIVL